LLRTELLQRDNSQVANPTESDKERVIDSLKKTITSMMHKKEENNSL